MVINMDTDALTIYDEENNSKQHTAGRTGGISALNALLRNNPEIPDALRDIMPYFSPAARPRIATLAALSDFMVRMSDTAAFSVNDSEERPPVSELYSTVKKYIPMNKRQNIDSVMGFVDNIKIKLQPKPAANGIESAINVLTRINEMSKLASSAGAVQKIASTINNSGKKEAMSPEDMISAISGIMGEDKMKQIGSMLGKLLG